FGHSSLSGTPAGAYHLTTDLQEVICSIVTAELRSGVDPKKVLKQVLTATDLNFAAVRPASKVTLDIARRYPVGPFNVVPNLLLPMVFNESGLDAILDVRNGAVNRGIIKAMIESGQKAPTEEAIEELRSECHVESQKYIGRVIQETEVTADKLSQEAVKAVEEVSKELSLE
ncbi:MAG: hypothetical protein JO170_04405, partial [Verrucomicrobia bacterium]|nr:hypothetical protein [Verrucomicrobiota bacterium]